MLEPENSVSKPIESGRVWCFKAWFSEYAEKVQSYAKVAQQTVEKMAVGNAD